MVISLPSRLLIFDFTAFGLVNINHSKKNFFFSDQHILCQGRFPVTITHPLQSQYHMLAQGHEEQSSAAITGDLSRDPNGSSVGARVRRYNVGHLRELGVRRSGETPPLWDAVGGGGGGRRDPSPRDDACAVKDRDDIPAEAKWKAGGEE